MRHRVHRSAVALRPFAQAAWRQLRPGDVLVLGLGLVVLGLFWRLTLTGDADTVIIERGGQRYAQASLRLDRVIDVPGPLGMTRVEIRDGRVRVLSDPSPRQLCVRQGWLAHGESALCLPNQVGVYRGRAAYDSLNY